MLSVMPGVHRMAGQISMILSFPMAIQQMPTIARGIHLPSGMLTWANGSVLPTETRKLTEYLKVFMSLTIICTCMSIIMAT